ncbi:hypothetical protein QQ045_027890 [Rhodiola kirilowii]
MSKIKNRRDVADTFKHSISTISKYLHKVLRALKKFSFDIVRPHTAFEEVPPKILNNSLYSPYFKDCIGALDGTHIQAILADDKGNQYRGRKGTKTWNVLACCFFDMIFTHVHVGWEGRKYYLVDSGYPNTIGYLAPYKDQRVRYHMPTIHNGDQPTGVYEKFNYRHSSLPTPLKEHLAS